jgi:uncharacterized protein (UPF0264 family)
MTELLVSVRSAEEAAAALAEGAGLIDVKDPFRGSLGRATEATITEVIRVVGGRRPVSAAQGELLEEAEPFALRGLTYLKWGLAGCGRRPGWPGLLAAAAHSLGQTNPRCRAVAVAYADWQRVAAPPPADVMAFARDHRWGAFLLDTGHKDGSTLLDWMTPAEVSALCRAGQAAGVRVALAGSLQLAQVAVLLLAEPDWLGVRGAVCRGGARGQAIDPLAVRRWAEALQRHAPSVS